jgi:NADPH-dependent 2,4-dienoyl-CoA reductase/sulfur reductase-like enzyme/nitrite reductase/ring-hydroxylating ferredoxin subunit
MPETRGFDFKTGVPLRKIPDGAIVAGHVDDDEIIVVHRGDEFFAVGAHCTHYHGPLADGLVVNETVRCPWHHACFSLRTGEAVRAPALDPIACWRVEHRGDTLFVTEKIDDRPARAPVAASASVPRSIVIVGGGAAGLAAADMLRRKGYDGTLTMISADSAPPVDRPNLSKDFLAGTAQEDWIPLRSPEFYKENRIDLQLNMRVDAIDVTGRRVRLAAGTTQEFDRLLLATGADPVHLNLAGTPTSPVHYLRTLADCRAIVASVTSPASTRALVIGASFIGLEVAASLRTRGLEVHVVAPDREPLERVMGADVGRFIRGVHDSKGVVFHLGTTVERLDGRTATLSDGSRLEADLVVVGVGVRPSLALAEAAGLAIDRGVAVDAYLQTSVPGIFAAGDIARWPDPRTGDRIRVEHWVVAERQGQTAARNMLGSRERFDAVPFFWSQHYDLSINYVGHAERWDAAQVDGDLSAHDATVTFKQSGRSVAVATILRDKASLEVEAGMEAETGTPGARGDRLRAGGLG